MHTRRLGLRFNGASLVTPSEFELNEQLCGEVGWLKGSLSLADGSHQGVLVALYLDPDVAKQIAITSGEPADSLHLTLCYCNGDIADALPVVEEMAKSWPPLTGGLDGVSSFEPSEGSDWKRPVYAVPVVEDLGPMREWLAKALDDAGVPPKNDYGDWIPHITLTYVDDTESPTVTLPENLDLFFDTITVIQGDERHDFPLVGGEIDAKTVQLRDAETEKPTPAAQDEVKAWLSDHDGWQWLREGLDKSFTFDNRRIAAAFIKDVMDHANAVNHHPNIGLYHEDVHVSWITRASDAITALDLECAAYTDEASQNPDTLALRLTFRESLVFQLETQRNRCGQFGDDDSTCPVGGESGGRGSKEPAAKSEQSFPNTTRSGKPRSARALTALKAQNPFTKEKEAWATKNEQEIISLTKGKGTDDNRPVDVVVKVGRKTIGLEVKTMLSNKSNQITMRGEAQARKRQWAIDNKAPVHTLVIDDRDRFGRNDLYSGHRLYYAPTMGSLRIDSMIKVRDERHLRSLMRGAA